MDAAVNKYLAQKIIEDFRSDNIPVEDLCQAVNKDPYIDPIRHELNQHDVAWLILHLSRSTDNAVFKLCLNLSLPLLIHKSSRQLREILLSLMKNGLQSHMLVYGVMNIEDLPVESHEQLFDCIVADRVYYATEEITYCGGSDKVLSLAETRLKDPHIPITKNWIYWFTASLAENKNAAIEFLTRIRPEHPQLDSAMNSLRKRIHSYLLENMLS